MTAMRDKNWNVLGCTVRGASHERTGRPNEDAIAMGTLTDGAGVFTALSDGHGSRACFRSSEGAARAVGIAADLLKDTHSLALLRSPHGLRQMAEELLQTWRSSVIRHLKMNPFRHEELEGLDAAQRMTLGRNALVAYGATLLICCAFDGETQFIQLGDGDFLTMDAAGSVSGVFGMDSRHMGNATTSLCLPNALDEFRYHRWSGNPPRMVMGSTDGYGNSFRSEADFYKTVRDYARLIDENGKDTVEKQMPTWLAETSRHGSGDDITVALIYRE